MLRTDIFRVASVGSGTQSVLEVDRCVYLDCAYRAPYSILLLEIGAPF
jgi:hypothetical protein